LLLLAGVLISGLVGLVLYTVSFVSDPRYAEYVAAQTEVKNPYYLGSAFDGHNIAAMTFKGTSNDVVLFVGDSHMGQYYPAVEKLYDGSPSRPYYTAVFVSHANCTPSPSTLLEIGDGNTRHLTCNDLFAAAIRMAGLPNVRRIVFGGNWQLTPKYDQSSLSAFGGAIRYLVAKKKRVIVILDNPQGDEFNPLVIVRQHRLNRYLNLPNFSLAGDRFINIDIPRQASLWRMGELETVVKSNGGQTVDPYDFLCSSSGCPIVLNGKPTHLDADHLRAFYVIQTATFMKTLLSK
jgi:hypothetical protein